MDQTVFAGIGNIYRAELLYRAKQNPFTAGKDISEQTLKAVSSWMLRTRKTSSFLFVAESAIHSSERNLLDSRRITCTPEVIHMAV
jgi:formamidopyrimidine-DNA glycosylase